METNAIKTEMTLHQTKHVWSAKFNERTDEKQGIALRQWHFTKEQETNATV